MSQDGGYYDKYHEKHGPTYTQFTILNLGELMNAELDECMESAERVLLECYEKAGTIRGNLPESNRGLRLQAAAMLANKLGDN